MRITIISIFFLSIIFNCMSVFSQTYRIAAQLKGKSKRVYIDLKGNIIAEPSHRFCYDYSEEGTAVTAVVVTNCHLLDINGNEIIPELKLKVYMGDYSSYYKNPNFNTESPFYGGIFRMKKKGKLGGIDATGKISVPFVYDKLTDFNNGYALGERDKKYFVVDKFGNEKPLDVNNIIYIKRFSEGFAPIEVKGQKWGFVDTTGKLVITPQFKTVGYFNGNHSWARTKKNIIGFINKEGDWVIKPQFSTVHNFDKEAGIAVVSYTNDTSYAYIDTTGKVLDFNLSDKLYDFSNGVAVAKSGNKVGYINNQGKWIIEPTFNKAHNFHNGFAAVKTKSGWGLINKQGEWVLQPEYKSMGKVVLIN